MDIYGTMDEGRVSELDASYSTIAWYQRYVGSMLALRL